MPLMWVIVMLGCGLRFSKNRYECECSERKTGRGGSSCVCFLHQAKLLFTLSHMVLISRPVAVVAGWQSYSSYAFVLGWVLWEKYVSLIHSLDETFCVTSYHEFDRTHEEEGG